MDRKKKKKYIKKDKNDIFKYMNDILNVKSKIAGGL